MTTNDLSQSAPQDETKASSSTPNNSSSLGFISATSTDSWKELQTLSPRNPNKIYPLIQNDSSWRIQDPLQTSNTGHFCLLTRSYFRHPGFHLHVKNQNLPKSRFLHHAFELCNEFYLIDTVVSCKFDDNTLPFLIWPWWLSKTPPMSSFVYRDIFGLTIFDLCTMIMLTHYR